MFLPAFPRVPGFSGEKEDLLNQICVGVVRGSEYVTGPTMFGRSGHAKSCKLGCVHKSEFSAVCTTSSGKPVWNVVIPEMVHPSVTRPGIQDMELKCRTLGSA